VVSSISDHATNRSNKKKIAGDLGTPQADDAPPAPMDLADIAFQAGPLLVSADLEPHRGGGPRHGTLPDDAGRHQADAGFGARTPVAGTPAVGADGTSTTLPSIIFSSSTTVVLGTLPQLVGGGVLSPAAPASGFVFTTFGTSAFRLLLNGLTAGAEVDLFTLGRTLIQRTTSVGTTPTTMVNTLPPGTYIVQVASNPGATTNYNLTMAAEPILFAPGLHINLQWDNLALSAPPAFRQAVQAAASMFERAFTDNITLNISVGWGEIGGAAIASGSASSVASGVWETYKDLLARLAAGGLSADDLLAISSIGAAQLAGFNPNGNGDIAVWRAQEKALQIIAPNDPGTDGSIGIGSNESSSAWLVEAIQSIANAMGKRGGGAAYGIFDLFRFATATSATATPAHVAAGGTPAYFSIDGGKTAIANFSNVPNYGNWAIDAKTPIDPFSNAAPTIATALTEADLTALDAIGFSRVGAPSDTIGNGFGVARPVTVTPGAFLNLVDFVGGTDTGDWYTFTTTGFNSLQVALQGLSANADVRLFAADGSTLLAQSTNTGTTDDFIRFLNLAAGTYFVAVTPVGTASTNYALSLFDTANAAGPIVNQLGSSVQTISGSVNNATKFDTYQFTTTGITHLTLGLTTLGANGAFLDLDSNSGPSFLATGTNIDIFNLPGGTYTIFVQGTAAAQSPYQINAAAFATGPVELAGSGVATAQLIVPSAQLPSYYFDSLNSVSDPQDFFKFTITGRSDVEVALSGLSANADLTLLAPDGSSELRSGALAGNLAEGFSIKNLAPGTYYLRVAPPNGAPRVSTNYTLAVRATPVPQTTGMNITFTLDPTSFGTAPPGVKAEATAALDEVKRFFHDNFADPINLAISVYWGMLPNNTTSLGVLGGDRGGSLVPLVTAPASGTAPAGSFAALKNWLSGRPGQTTVDATTISHLTPIQSLPTGATGLSYELPGALLQTNPSGSIGFNSLANWDYNPGNGIDPASLDFVAVAMHEVSEVLGRFSGGDILLSPGHTVAVATPLDLVRYTQTAAQVPTLALGGTAASYFSIDGGITSLQSFSPTHDRADWVGALNDAFTTHLADSSLTGIDRSVTEPDLELMDVIGYTRTAPSVVAFAGPIATTFPGSGMLSVSSGLNAPNLAFIGGGTPERHFFGPDAVVASVGLGNGLVELIQNFVLGTDEITIALNNLPRANFRMSDTIYNGSHAVSIYDSGDPAHGIIVGLPGTVTAAVLQSHVQSYGQNLAVIS
jgi:Bacterial pre-peptidase C-terminal domain